MLRVSSVRISKVLCGHVKVHGVRFVRRSRGHGLRAMAGGHWRADGQHQVLDQAAPRRQIE